MQKTIYWTILASEAGHIFCCALPAIISILSLFSAFGLMGIIPGFVLDIHDFMHNWEMTVIIFSAVILALGWALHAYSKKMDCHSNGCGHKPCAPKKSRTEKVLIIATLLFAFNLTLFLGFHKDGLAVPNATEIEAPIHHDHHDGHHH